MTGVQTCALPISSACKKRCVIVGGADIGDYARVKQYLRADDAIVFCDSGLKHMEALGVKPALIVGDFDSHCNPHLDVETIVLPCEKDDTDTVFAAVVDENRRLRIDLSRRGVDLELGVRARNGDRRHLRETRTLRDANRAVRDGEDTRR